MVNKGRRLNAANKILKYFNDEIHNPDVVFKSDDYTAGTYSPAVKSIRTLLIPVVLDTCSEYNSELACKHAINLLMLKNTTLPVEYIKELEDSLG